MNEELNLPPEIIINILSRLPIRTITTSKCICKPWLHLIETSEFAKSHLSKSVPGLLVYQCETSLDLFKIFDFEEAVEELDHKLHYSRITEVYQGQLSNPFHPNVGIGGSVNGLLFLRDLSVKPKSLYIHNPITRECIHLPQHHEWIQFPTFVTYGFGVSKMSGEYKVARIYYDRILDPHNCSLQGITTPECWIYTLGTATWRTIPSCDTFDYNSYSDGVFVNGNLHWLVVDLKGSCLVSCLNLETEHFSCFSTRVGIVSEGRQFQGMIAFLGDCLCLCDNNTSDGEIVIWVMKEYGVETSWTKELVIGKSPELGPNSPYPLKVFRDGNILMWLETDLFYYSNKTKTITKLDMFELRTWGRIMAVLHTPAFVSLKDFVLEHVTSFSAFFPIECPYVFDLSFVWQRIMENMSLF